MKWLTTILGRLIKKGSCETESFEPRTEKSEGVSRAGIWGRAFQEEKSQGRGMLGMLEEQ